MGTVTKTTKRAVYVVWDDCSFDDEMAWSEVRRLDVSDAADGSDQRRKEAHDGN